MAGAGTKTGAKGAARGKRAAQRPKVKRTLRVRSGDRVQIVAGKDRGKTGRVLRVDPTKERVYVEGLNMVKKHTRPQQLPSGGTTGRGTTVGGGVIEIEGPVHVSNVALLDPKGGKPTRVGVEREDGKPYRIARRSGARID